MPDSDWWDKVVNDRDEALAKSRMAPSRSSAFQPSPAPERTKLPKTTCWQTFHIATKCQLCHTVDLGISIKAHVQPDFKILCESCCSFCKAKKGKSGDLFED